MTDKIKVLIVDDSADMRESLRAKYESFGYQVVGEARDGLEGLQMMKELQPNFVSLDIIMPEMDGIECCVPNFEIQESQCASKVTSWIHSTIKQQRRRPRGHRL